MKPPVTIAILGAGARGATFGAAMEDMLHLGRVTAVAEPRESYRKSFAETYEVPPEQIFSSWEDFVAQPQMCDAVIITTMDRDHAGPAVACMEKGYHVLLEKPMATNLEDCRAIVEAQQRTERIMGVCHSLRYNKEFQKVKDVVASGRIGDIVTLDHLEGVGFFHQAHSYVRGNWANETRSSCMLLAKSCHDLDFISYLVDRPCVKVGSFGALNHFTKQHAPPGSTERCTDGCSVESTCEYSAIRQYVRGSLTDWPASVVSHTHTREAHMEAIRKGPYGRCVYRSDNDVVDHQVVMLHFEGDITATFTMTAFSLHGNRQMRIHGTRGELYFDNNRHTIVVQTYADHNVEEIRLAEESGGHGGGDHRLLQNWLHAIRTSDDSSILASAEESFKTHSLVFAAEIARREGRVVDIQEFNRI